MRPGVDHPALRAGALYPPIAANLTVLLFQTVVHRTHAADPQRLVCHRGEPAADVAHRDRAPSRERYEKRGREYADVEAESRGPTASRSGPRR